MSSDNTQLTSAINYDAKSRMIFSEPQVGSIPDSKPPISYRRINISTRNSDGSVGELVLPIGRSFSFGVSENVDPQTGKINGYVFPICLYGREGPTEEEKKWVETFDNIVENCRDYLIDNKEELDQFELQRSDLRKLNPLYWKREKVTDKNGKITLQIVDGVGPTLYAKLIVSKKHEKVITQFYSPSGEQLNPMDLQGKYCYARAAIKIESIFIGNKISLQVKLYECEVEPMQTGVKRLLPRPEGNTRVLSMTPSNAPPMSIDDTDETNQAGSLPTSDNEDTKTSKTTSAPVKRVVKKVVKKTKVVDE
jgi:hypothetical protein